MDAIRVTLFIVIASSYSVICYPSRPLNERSTELAWQAWLLVDENQNQNRHDPDQLRRRITPKSVFIAPTFSPDSLPACSDGYRPDSMGRCIRIIKIDEAAHLEFLLEKLNSQFAGMDYDEEQEEITTTGPYQVNIPLVEAPNNQQIAIVVAPTKGFLDEETDAIKQPIEINSDSDQLGLPQEQTLKQFFEPTEINSNSDGNLTETTTEYLTTTNSNTEQTTINQPETESSIDTTEISTIPEEVSTLDTTSQQTLSGITKPTEDQTTKLLNIRSSDREEITTMKVEETTKLLNLIHFPTEQTNLQLSSLPPSETIIFPDSYAKRYQHTLPPTYKEPQTTSTIVYNHRNRDKHINLWSLSSWGEESPKPIVLRYSRQSATGRHLLAEHLTEKRSFYRQVPSREFSYLFGTPRQNTR